MPCSHENTSVYLAGSMAAASDLGRGWRDKVRPIFQLQGFDVVNPLDIDDDLAKMFGYSKMTHKTWIDLRENRWNDFVKACQYIVKTDTKAVSKIKILVIYLNPNAMISLGTAGEITLAGFLGIPVFAVLDGVRDYEIPIWMRGCITSFFDSWEDLFERIDEEYSLFKTIDSQKQKGNGLWIEWKELLLNLKDQTLIEHVTLEQEILMKRTFLLFEKSLKMVTSSRLDLVPLKIITGFSLKLLQSVLKDRASLLWHQICHKVSRNQLMTKK